MPHPAQHLGRVRVWHDGESWKWVEAGKWAPEDAELGDRHRTEDGEEVISVQDGTEGRFIRGAVKAAFGILKPSLSFCFVHSQLNDLFAMPFILGYSNMLIVTVAPNDHYLIHRPMQIGALTLLCAVVWEIIGPLAVMHSVGDWADVVAYGTGSTVYYFFQRLANAPFLPLPSAPPASWPQEAARATVGFRR
jgi:hypothetical protein